LTRIFRRWWPEGATSRQGRLAVGFNLASAIAAVVLFVALAPPVTWSHPELLAALAAVAVVAFFAEVRLKAAVLAHFDATFILALIALALAGPLPALLVWLVPDLISRLVIRRSSIVSPALVANVSSYALAVLAGYEVLRIADPASLTAAAPTLLTAGLVMVAINFSVARLAFAPFYQRYRPIPLIRSEFIDLVPAHLAMLALAVLTVVLIPPLGVFALGLLAAAVLVPEIVVAALLRERSVARLARGEATRLYAEAIADMLELDRRQRRIVACAAELLADRDAVGVATVTEYRRRWRHALVPDVVQAALYVRERWDGEGTPAGVSRWMTPLASRVVAVADAWSELTAAGSPELPHAQAMLDLGTRAGTEFDPVIVAAAARVVEEERAFVRDPSFAPRLHRLPLSHRLRRARLPALLARLAAPV
jgi:HD domain-containing protein